MASVITDRVNVTVGGAPVSSAGQGIYVCSNVAGTNDVTADTTPAITSYPDNGFFSCRFVNANGGAMTVDFGPGAISLLTPAGGALVGGEVSPNVEYLLKYDGTAMRFFTF